MRQRADLLVLEPLHAVQAGAALAVDVAQAARLVGGVARVEHHHAAPVLAWVPLLRHVGQLGLHRGAEVVLHAHQRVLVVGEVQQLGDVAKAQEVVVHEGGPAAVAREVGDQEAQVCKLRALLGVLLAPVDASLLQLLALERDHLHGNGGALEDGVPEHLPGHLLVAVVAYVDAERRVHGCHLRGAADGLGHDYRQEKGNVSVELGGSLRELSERRCHDGRK
mmetsp:Transcript_21657/g.56441  ORF Transcript_21657/g.56441 Transcript_21657/m.56441 type:complete len:222 (+) Transcript_21657:501-1166(+)